VIDLNKPIELMDGTEVEFFGRWNGEYCLYIAAHDDHFYVDINGQIGGAQVIRNRTEQKKILVDFWLGVYWNGTDIYTRKYATYATAIQHLSLSEEGVGLVRIRFDLYPGEGL